MRWSWIYNLKWISLSLQYITTGKEWFLGPIDLLQGAALKEQSLRFETVQTFSRNDDTILFFVNFLNWIFAKYVRLMNLLVSSLVASLFHSMNEDQSCPGCGIHLLQHFCTLNFWGWRYTHRGGKGRLLAIFFECHSSTFYCIFPGTVKTNMGFS